MLQVATGAPDYIAEPSWLGVQIASLAAGGRPARMAGLDTQVGQRRRHLIYSPGDLRVLGPELLHRVLQAAS
jgi:hypothetical protein